MDELDGARVADAGPLDLHGEAGADTDHDLGRFHGALRLRRTLDSFVYVPFHPRLETGGTCTVEAWIRPAAFGAYEDTPIAARWSEDRHRQSWLFALTGRRTTYRHVVQGNMIISEGDLGIGPGYHCLRMVTESHPGRIMFAFRSTTGETHASFSLGTVELDRWTHVAVSYDGAFVRFFIDGRLDSQQALIGTMGASAAPLVIGNYFGVTEYDPLGGRVRRTDRRPFYAFEGSIDELRISSVARTEFPGVRP